MANRLPHDGLEEHLSVVGVESEDGHGVVLAEHHVGVGHHGGNVAPKGVGDVGSVIPVDGAICGCSTKVLCRRCGALEFTVL